MKFYILKFILSPKVVSIILLSWKSSWAIFDTFIDDQEQVFIQLCMGSRDMQMDIQMFDFTR